MPTRKLFHNGKIFTSVTGDETLHQALLVEDDKVVFVGSEKDAVAQASRKSYLTSTTRQS